MRNCVLRERISVKDNVVMKKMILCLGHREMMDIRFITHMYRENMDGNLERNRLRRTISNDVLKKAGQK